MVGKGSKIIKFNLQPHPTMATEPARATCAQVLDGDSATSLGSLFHCQTTLTMKKFSLISKTRAPHYCQTSSAIHALVWREREALQDSGLGLGGAESKDTQDFSPVSVQDGVWGPGAFPKVSPRCSGLGSASGTSQGNRGTTAQTSAGTEELLACLLTLRNPIHNQTLNPNP